MFTTPTDTYLLQQIALTQYMRDIQHIATVPVLPDTHVSISILSEEVVGFLSLVFATIYFYYVFDLID